MIALVAPRQHVSAASEPVLMQAMEAELHRAMTSLGSTNTTGDNAQPKPYFVSYGVADSETVSISAQYGAITASNQSHRRTADVQVRLGSPLDEPRRLDALTQARMEQFLGGDFTGVRVHVGPGAARITGQAISVNGGISAG